MTTQELQQLADQHIQQHPTGPGEWDEGGGFNTDTASDIYQAGFMKALELMKVALRAHGGLDDYDIVSVIGSL